MAACLAVICRAASTERVATLIELNGPIGPAMSRFVERSLQAAAGDSALVILQMDTPGGLDTAMRDIIKAILASPVPVVSYVAPAGARAASAGTYILYASHFAAMAPATNLGAATPVSLGPSEPEKSGTEVPADAHERKAVNDAVAYIHSLAQLRSRNADWAEQAVRGAASLSATDALAQHVIDLVARDVPDLLSQLNGRKCLVAGREVTLDTSSLSVRRTVTDWRTRVLLVITHPTIAYGLLLIGIYGLLLEGYNPGVVLPGVVGAISLVLGLYALQLLAVNYAGLALIVLGIGLIAAEFFMPAYGSLGVGGLLAFVIGSVMLFDSRVPGMQVALPVVVGMGLAGGAIVVGIVWLAARARARPVAAGVESMIGAMVEATRDCDQQCVVRYGGELWNARTAAPLRAGQRARIIKVEGLTLLVEPQPGTKEIL
jgi:membrane-bound serine protease (ClpP class)